MIDKPGTYEQHGDRLQNWSADPNALTPQQLLREVNNLKEIVFTRLDAIDKATVLLQSKADKSPTVGEVVEKLQAFKDEVAERDKRYSAEFIKLSTIASMMTEQQALALAATKEAVSVAMSASEKAVAKAETSAEKRFESINEFRAQLADQQATFARSDLVNQRTDGLEKKMDEIARGLEARLTDSKDRLTTIEASAAGTARTFGFIATGIGVVAAVAGAVAAIFLRGGI